MKYSQQDLEILVLAYITKDSKLMDKALAKGINLSHFEYVEEDEKKSYTKALYKIALDYFQESGGSLITSYVIEAYLNKFNTPARIKGKVLILWEEIQAIDIDPKFERPLKVFTDSELLINSLTKWLPGWKAKNWKKADGAPVKNVDLLKELEELMKKRRVSFKHVRAHTGKKDWESINNDLAPAK